MALVELVRINSDSVDYNGMPVSTVLSKGFINPQLPPYNYKPTDTLAERTASVMQAINDANSTFRTVVLDTAYYVSKLHIKDMRDFSVIGAGALIGEGNDDGTYVLGIENCTNVKVEGLSVSTTGTREIGVKVWGSGSTCSLNHFSLNVTNVVCAWQFGDLLYPDNLVSEISVSNGYTYNVTEVIRVYGSQCVIEFNSYQAIALGTQTANTTIATVKGGLLRMNGGEAQMTTISTGVGFRLQPIDSPMNTALGGNQYGHISLNGVSFECASVQLLATNPDNVPNLLAGTGSFSMESTTGYISLNSTDLLQGDNSFSGRVYVAPSCYFHRNGNLPGSSFVSGMGAGCRVRIAEGAYTDAYRTGLQLFRPNLQVPLYNSRRIFTATNLAGATVVNGTEPTLGFTAKSATGENVFYYGAYNAGLFTVPTGGLKDVEVSLNIATISSISTGACTVSVLVGSTVVGQRSFSGQYFNSVFEVGDVPAGAVIQIKLLNLTGGSISFGSTNTDAFVVRARTL